MVNLSGEGDRKGRRLPQYKETRVGSKIYILKQRIWPRFRDFSMQAFSIKQAFIKASKRTAISLFNGSVEFLTSTEMLQVTLMEVPDAFHLPKTRIPNVLVVTDDFELCSSP